MSAYLELKRTGITTTGIIFASLLGYAFAVKDLVLAQYLIGTLVIILLSIFIAYVVETKASSKQVRVRRQV